MWQITMRIYFYQENKIGKFSKVICDVIDINRRSMIETVFKP